MDGQQNNSGKGGFLRLKQVLSLIPVSKTYWYKGIKKGIFPKPVKAAKIAFYRREEIEQVIQNMSANT